MPSYALPACPPTPPPPLAPPRLPHLLLSCLVGLGLLQLGHVELLVLLGALAHLLRGGGAVGF